jgi:hypothetical protein
MRVNASEKRVLKNRPDFGWHTVLSLRHVLQGNTLGQVKQNHDSSEHMDAACPINIALLEEHPHGVLLLGLLEQLVTELQRVKVAFELIRNYSIGFRFVSRHDSNMHLNVLKSLRFIPTQWSQVACSTHRKSPG